MPPPRPWRQRSVAALLVALAALASGCFRSLVDGRPSPDGTDDAGVPDARAADLPHDAGGTVEAGPVDVGLVDAGLDEGPIDVGPDVPVDLGPPPPAPVLRAPARGALTGSVHAEDGVATAPLRPWLTWLPVAGASSYRVQMAACTAGPWRACDFEGPEVDEELPGEPTSAGEVLRARPARPLPVDRTPPVGRRYVWRVAACRPDGCGAFSGARYLLVGRARHDLNGDGYGDLSIGAPFQAAASSDVAGGAVFIYLGGPDGPGPRPDVELASPNAVAFGVFGFSIAALGDVNGDGYGDLAIGAEGELTGRLVAGRAYVVLGGPTGPTGTPVALEPPRPLLAGAFGGVVAPGDVNGDGFADLVVRDGEGEVFFYLGGESGIASTPAVTLRAPPEDEGNPGFGASVGGPGDVDGDGFPDVAVGFFEIFEGEGEVLLFRGSPSGLAATATVTLRDDAESRLRARYGAALAGGDLDLDGLSDVLVGSPGSDGVGRQPGRLLLHAGGTEGAAATPTSARQARRFFDIDLFGGTLAEPADMNGDGFLDVVVGLGLVRSDEAVFLYLGSETGLAADAQELRLPRESSGAYPAAVSTPDTNGDGFADLLIGQAIRAGRAYLLLGGPAGVSSPPTLTLQNPRTAPDAQSFGVSVAP